MTNFKMNSKLDWAGFERAYFLIKDIERLFLKNLFDIPPFFFPLLNALTVSILPFKYQSQMTNTSIFQIA